MVSLYLRTLSRSIPAYAHVTLQICRCEYRIIFRCEFLHSNMATSTPYCSEASVHRAPEDLHILYFKQHQASEYLHHPIQLYTRQHMSPALGLSIHLSKRRFVHTYSRKYHSEMGAKPYPLGVKCVMSVPHRKDCYSVNYAGEQSWREYGVSREGMVFLAIKARFEPGCTSEKTSAQSPGIVSFTLQLPWISC